MRHRRRSVNFAGQPFSFDRIQARESERTRVTWAVSRRGEFIGTMTTPSEVTTKDFDVRGMQWLTELLSRSRVHD